jgi:hypothetical protein
MYRMPGKVVSWSAVFLVLSRLSVLQQLGDSLWSGMLMVCKELLCTQAVSSMGRLPMFGCCLERQLPEHWFEHQVLFYFWSAVQGLRSCHVQ